MTNEDSKKLNNARKLIRNKNYEEAENDIRELLNKNSSDLTIMFQYGMLLSIMEKYDEAESFLNHFINKNDKYGITALVELGNNAIKQGNYDLALKYYRILKNFNYTLSKILLANINISKFEYMEAYKIYDELYSKYNNEEYKNKCEELLNLNKEKQMNLEYINYLYENISYLLKSGQYKEAYDQYQLFNTIKLYNRENDVKVLGFYIRAKLGLLTDDEKQTDSYLKNQMINYDALEAIYHTINVDEKNKSKNKAIYFDADLNIEDLYLELSNNIMDKIPYEIGYVDKYFVTFDNRIGIDEGFDTNTIKVVTLGGTKDIVAIYPFHAKAKMSKKLK